MQCIPKPKHVFSGVKIYNGGDESVQRRYPPRRSFLSHPRNAPNDLRFKGKSRTTGVRWRQVHVECVCRQGKGSLRRQRGDERCEETRVVHSGTGNQDGSSSLRKSSSTKAQRSHVCLSVSTLDAYDYPKPIEISKCFKYDNHCQKQKECVHKFIVVTSWIADNWNVSTMCDRMLRDRIVCGVQSKNL